MQWTEDILRDIGAEMAPLSRASGADLDPCGQKSPRPSILNDAAFRDYTASIARASETPFLFGAVGFTPQREPLNSAVMIDPSGKIVDRYDKINLVPFGEFIPPLFGWVNRITHEIGDFVPGDRVVSSAGRAQIWGVHLLRIGVPDLVREFTDSGAEVLVNLSNDGYFGNSAAHEQHLEIVRMRAAENRRWILRATNDGITAVDRPARPRGGRMPPFTQTAATDALRLRKRPDALYAIRRLVRLGCLAAGFALRLSLTSAGSPAHRRP